MNSIFIVRITNPILSHPFLSLSPKPKPKLSPLPNPPQLPRPGPVAASQPPRHQLAGRSSLPTPSSVHLHHPISDPHHHLHQSPSQHHPHHLSNLSPRISSPVFRRSHRFPTTPTNSGHHEDDPLLTADSSFSSFPATSHSLLLPVSVFLQPACSFLVFPTRAARILPRIRRPIACSSSSKNSERCRSFLPADLRAYPAPDPSCLPSTTTLSALGCVNQSCHLPRCCCGSRPDPVPEPVTHSDFQF